MWTKGRIAALIVWLVFCTAWLVETLSSHHYVNAAIVAFGAVVTPFSLWIALRSLRQQRRTTR